MKFWQITLLSLFLLISVTCAEPSNSSSAKEEQEDRSCGQAAAVLDSDMKPNMSYASNLYKNCSCFSKKKDLTRTRECYEKVVSCCDKISSLEALDLQDDAVDYIYELEGDLHKAAPGSNCSCSLNSSYDSIISRYDQILANDSSNMVGWNNRGVLLGELCCLNASLQSFKQAISINSSAAEPWYNKGVALYRNDPSQALQCFNRSLELDPELAEAWFNRYAILMPDMEDLHNPASRLAYQEALDSYLKAIAYKRELEFYEPPYLVFKKI
ncbi:MAG: hypothetical protein NTY37_13170 [Methanothrix sp.]|nr:hypothetical protein [Methanothrix sp.]